MPVVASPLREGLLRLAAALLLGTALGGPAQAQSIPLVVGAIPPEDVIALAPDGLEKALAALPASIEDTLRRSLVPGAAVAVVHGGTTVFARGFGVREIGRNAAVEADDRVSACFALEAHRRDRGGHSGLQGRGRLGRQGRAASARSEAPGPLRHRPCNDRRLLRASLRPSACGRRQSRGPGFRSQCHHRTPPPDSARTVPHHLQLRQFRLHPRRRGRGRPPPGNPGRFLPGKRSMRPWA